jgi:cysteine desulfurase
LAARDVARAAQIKVLRDVLETAILELTPEAIILGAEAPRLANTSCIAWPGKLAETLVIRLDLAGIAVSAGSACSSGKVGQSHVLAAIGLMPEIAGRARHYHRSLPQQAPAGRCTFHREFTKDGRCSRDD